MPEWFLRLIGISDDFVHPKGEVHLFFHHPWVLFVGFALLIPVGYLIITRQQRNLYSAPPALKAALSATRIAVLILLVIVLASPYLQLHFEQAQKPIVAVLLDYSQSMQLEAGPYESEDEVRRIAGAAGYQTADGKISAETRKALNKIGRAKLAQSVAENSGRAMLQDLSKKFDVQYYSFAKEVEAIGVNPADLKLPEPPHPRETWGSSTEIGDAILDVLNKAGDRQVSGIVLFSDGQATGGRSPAEAAQQAAITNSPIFAVQTGVATRIRDVAIVDVFTSGLVSLGDTVRVAVTIESQGFDKRPVKVELKEADRILDTKDLILSSAEQQQLELSFKADRAGPRYLTVHIPPQPEEPKDLHVNNTESAFVRVSEEKLRVLFLEGLPRWDYRFLKNAMRRDHGLGGLLQKDQPDIVLEAELRRLAEPAQAKALPRSAKDLSEYHAIILGDVSPKVLTPDFIKALNEAVRERGVGLIVEAGPIYMPHAYEADLQELLPVKLRPRTAGLEAPGGKPFRLQLTPEGSIHEAMRFYDDAGRNLNAWSRLPPFYWSVAAERPSPAASVLVWSPSVQNDYGKLPLIAVHYAGKGKVMLVGTDATWMWRQNVGDRFFYKFWGQSLRSVARRDQTGAKKSWIEVNPYRLQPHEQAQVELMAFTADGTPRSESSLGVQLIGANHAEKVELAADPSTKGRYLGKVTPRAAGDFRIVYTPGDGGEPAEAKLRAQFASEELRHPNVNRATLEMLASTSRGLFLQLDELKQIPDQLKGETKVQTLDREATLWDNWLMLTLLIGIYAVDVGLRRLVGLS
jgi:hypothetical protein